MLIVVGIFGCSSSSDQSVVPEHHQFIVSKYAAITSGAANRSLTMGTAFSNSPQSNDSNLSLMAPYTSALTNGRVISKDTVWLNDEDSVDYVTFSFLSDDFLNTKTVQQGKSTTTTQVWRHYNNKWCPILAFQPDNKTPLLGFSVGAAAPWIETHDGQVTYRLFVGTAEGMVGKVSFLDTDPKNPTCNTTIGMADGETSHAVFYSFENGSAYNLPSIGLPINGMKLATIQESQQSLEMQNKRVLYFWGNTSDCITDQCDNWKAAPAMSLLLVNGKVDRSYNFGYWSDNWEIEPLDREYYYNGNRSSKAKVGDVDLRLKYDNATRNLKMDLAIVYQTLPNDRQGNDFTSTPNITTRTVKEFLNTVDDYSNITALLAGNLNSGQWSHHAGPVQFNNKVRYSATAKVQIFDSNGDSNQTYVAVSNVGDANRTGVCPIIGLSSDCKEMGWFTVNYANYLIAANGPVSVSRLEVAEPIKSHYKGLENIAFAAQNLNQPNTNPFYPFPGTFPFDTTSSGIAIMEAGQPGTLSSKRYLQGYSGDDFVSKSPYSGGVSGAITGVLNLGKMRSILVPDHYRATDPRYARLFIIIPVVENFLYNPVNDGLGKANTKGGLLMCTSIVDFQQFSPTRISAANLLNDMDCTQEWQPGMTTGYRYASAQDIVLNGTYQTSIAGMDIAVSPTGQVNLGYVSSAGALLNLNITDSEQAWTGQASWTMISQGRAASCANELYKPVVHEQESKPFWKKALSKMIPIAGPMIAGESFTAALEESLVNVAEIGGDLTCDALGLELASPMCGVQAGKAADLLIDAVDSKAKQDSNPYKEAYENTRELTKCTGG